MNLETQLSVLGETYEIILDKPFAGVYYFSDSKIAYIYWKKPVAITEYQEAFNAILKKHKQTPAIYFLSDIVNQGVSSNDKKEWFREVVLKEAIDGGLKKGAIITDGNPFRDFYINIILGSTNKMGLPFKSFHNAKDAKDWLTKK